MLKTILEEHTCLFFFHTVVHGCSLAVSVGGCVLALCSEHVCGQRCCLVDQPLELSESHFTLRHLRSVLRTDGPAGGAYMECLCLERSEAMELAESGFGVLPCSIPCLSQ